MQATALLDAALLASAVACGLMAGFFFAFSVCVMRALAALAPDQGIAAMRSINVVVINPWFLTPFFGMALMGGLLMVTAVMRWHEPGAAYILAGGGLYVAGTFLVTLGFNVPLNNALAATQPTSAQGTALWARYLSVWTKWNHVRTIASLLAAAAFTVARTP